MPDIPEKVNLSDVNSRQVDPELLNELRDLFVKAEEQKERYDFTWNGKAKAYFEAAAPTTKTLRVQPEESVNFEKSENLFITGDNLEALKLLQESYLGKIDMIYIDPPYNTGKDFVYQDNFKKTQKENDVSEGIIDEDGNRLVKNEKSNGRYHSDWLTMMYPRLKLARNLLSDTGVIFVSIDDNEQANLKLLMDEIFGEDNFIGNLSVENNPKGRKNAKFISVSSEFVILYAKKINESKFIENIPKRSTEMIKDENGNFVHNSGKRILVGENKFNDVVTNYSSKKHYSVYYQPEKQKIHFRKEKDILDIDNELIGEGYIRYISETNNKFVENTYSIDKFMELFETNSLQFTDTKIFEKNFSTTKRLKSIVTNLKYQAIINNKPTDYHLDLTTTKAKQTLKLLFDNREVFSSPKSTDLIKLFLTLFSSKNITVFDFFAGSGTTADSVMQLNAEDGGNRKFILGTLDEVTPDNSEARKAGYTTIDQLSRERIRRAAEKIGDKTGFRALKVDSTGLKEDIFKTAGELDQLDLLKDIDNQSDNRSDYDLLYDVLVDAALEYNRPITIDTMNNEKIIKYDYLGELSGVVCYFGENLTDELTRQIATLKPLLAVFKESTFDKSAQKVNVMEQFRIISPDTKVKVI
ncbi:site-specific DNA-methyltransferase [Enterococcus faecalis]|uniref:site-specific DNA-methyltransferase n=1 Tax=Lactococcus petauri TaxID=1940789 RepID=UPI001A1058EE|nr:site-specific DNA-methyltransferase [Enterococcus faecalis]EGO2651620.1 site-specific DNA-methyltransferase [Enterococcus faecalis]EGO5177265.1 site-specific DNA-methyltransferase [Enterococcus faecalis]EGO5913287.1 site-specific DNA-methyltransferase [Enterococcus faecalis]EGO6003231.1 site-specific DNA-methyltransferase [Enterococcus faecalis]